MSRNHLDLGVRISTSNEVLARQFTRALDFWAGVVDLEWHNVHSHDCSIQLVDGTPELFSNVPGRCACIAARSQLPDRSGFEGWIAFNPTSVLTEREMFVVCVHEIGHLLGLNHNPSGSSVMFYFRVDNSPSLNAADLEALGLRHKLRPGLRDGNQAVTIESSSLRKSEMP